MYDLIESDFLEMNYCKQSCCLAEGYARLVDLSFLDFVTSDGGEEGGAWEELYSTDPSIVLSDSKEGGSEISEDLTFGAPPDGTG